MNHFLAILVLSIYAPVAIRAADATEASFAFDKYVGNYVGPVTAKFGNGKPAAKGSQWVEITKIESGHRIQSVTKLSADELCDEIWETTNQANGIFTVHKSYQIYNKTNKKVSREGTQEGYGSCIGTLCEVHFVRGSNPEYFSHDSLQFKHDMAVVWGGFLNSDTSGVYSGSLSKVAGWERTPDR